MSDSTSEHQLEEFSEVNKDFNPLFSNDNKNDNRFVVGIGVCGVHYTPVMITGISSRPVQMCPISRVIKVARHDMCRDILHHHCFSLIHL